MDKSQGGHETHPRTYGLYLGGGWQDPSATFPSRNPATPTDVVGHFAEAAPADVSAACDAAAAAADRWRRTNPFERAEVLHAVHDILKGRADALARDLTREEGKTLAESRAEVLRAAQIFRYFAGECAQPAGELYPSASDDSIIFSAREPVGVVAVITPWNFPIAIPAWKIAPALAYGNSVVWKPSELTPLLAVRLTEALHEAGLPPGVLNLVTGMPDVIGDALVDNHNLGALSFTGSAPVGRAIQARAVRRGVKVQLELGGKNPIIVLPDANLEEAVNGTVRGAMLSSGQKCSATSRAIVHSAVVERYVERVLARVERLRIGDPLSPETDIGPVVSEAQLEKIEDYFDVAATEGHERAVGGAPISPRPDDGYFVGPTVYLNVPRDSRIGQEEIFGPVLAVMEAESRESALEIANCSEYGLSASIYTHDLGAALQLSREIKAGVVHVNSETTGAEPHVPFGGMKSSSSHSREQGKAAREFYTDCKTIYVTAP